MKKEKEEEEEEEDDGKENKTRDHSWCCEKIFEKNVSYSIIIHHRLAIQTLVVSFSFPLAWEEIGKSMGTSIVLASKHFQ